MREGKRSQYIKTRSIVEKQAAGSGRERKKKTETQVARESRGSNAILGDTKCPVMSAAHATQMRFRDI